MQRRGISGTRKVLFSLHSCRDIMDSRICVITAACWKRAKLPLSMATLTTSSLILADVERALASPEALSRLVEGLLGVDFSSPLQRQYVAQLVWYVFYRRRRDICRQRGRLLSLPDGRVGSGCGAWIDWEVARAQARSMEWDLAQEIGAEAVRDLKRRVGKKLSLKACIWRIRDGRYEID